MQVSSVTIRPANPGDLDAMSSLLHELFSIEDDFSFDRRKQMRGLELLITRDAARLLVAESNGRVAGMCSGQMVISTAEGGPAVLVEYLVVNKTWREKGLGRRLLAAIAQWARGNGATRLQLLADRENQQALNFYSHIGWERTKLICLRFKRGMTRSDHGEADI